MKASTSTSRSSTWPSVCDQHLKWQSLKWQSLKWQSLKWQILASGSLRRR